MGVSSRSPIKDSFLETIKIRESSNTLHPMLQTLGNEIDLLFTNQPDYVSFLKFMDGFEYNGLILFSFLYQNH
jgi:hypothetical protein